jgi:hypothetical protein
LKPLVWLSNQGSPADRKQGFFGFAAMGRRFSVRAIQPPLATGLHKAARMRPRRGVVSTLGLVFLG